ncbi:MAG: hypothetical protein JXD22_10315 [Sedimentisphaerales bacterium]|nr:hypothetical protein [Sedimentisphaerales bacterium]
MAKKDDQKYPPIDVSKLSTFPTAQRQHKVDLGALAKLPEKGATMEEFFGSLPDFLGARQLQQLAEVIAAAVKKGRPVFFAMGAHVIKVGCSPIIIDLMRRGMLSGIALNGAGGIHDFEMALAGQTSEDVGANLNEGKFGMTEEAPEILAEAARRGSAEQVGLAGALGKIINERELPHREISLLAAADKYGKLSTMHVALGTDTVHMHPQADGAAIGNSSLIDFRRICSAVADLADGGVWVNVGSAVVLPEVFLKAVSVARNLGANLDEMYTANLDMISHYRAQQNVLARPVRKGNSFMIIGHHEITLPLLRMWLLQLL